ncbi:MAG: hypothetical protein GY953_19550 [bacterium]|nr:hypothetical protein [bacterium]
MTDKILLDVSDQIATITFNNLIVYAVHLFKRDSALINQTKHHPDASGAHIHGYAKKPLML